MTFSHDAPGFSLYFTVCLLLEFRQRDAHSLQNDFSFALIEKPVQFIPKLCAVYTDWNNDKSRNVLFKINRKKTKINVQREKLTIVAMERSHRAALWRNTIGLSLKGKCVQTVVDLKQLKRYKLQEKRSSPQLSIALPPCRLYHWQPNFSGYTAVTFARISLTRHETSNRAN